MQNWYKDVTPEDLTDSHRKFLDILSIPDILELCEVYGGASAYIPKNDEVYNQVVRNRAVREDYQKGATAVQLARKYSISERTVTRILRP